MLTIINKKIIELLSYPSFISHCCSFTYLSGLTLCIILEVLHYFGISSEKIAHFILSIWKYRIVST